MILNGRQHCRVVLLPFAFSQKRQIVFVLHTIHAKSEQNVSAISTNSFPHLTKFCPENKFCWTSVPCCAKTTTRTRNGAELQGQLRHCGFSMISRSTCEGFCVSKGSSPAFITPLQQVISILGSSPNLKIFNFYLRLRLVFTNFTAFAGLRRVCSAL